MTRQQFILSGLTALTPLASSQAARSRTAQTESSRHHRLHHHRCEIVSVADRGDSQVSQPGARRRQGRGLRRGGHPHLDAAVPRVHTRTQPRRRARSCCAASTTWPANCTSPEHRPRDAEGHRRHRAGRSADRSPVNAGQPPQRQHRDRRRGRHPLERRAAGGAHHQGRWANAARTGRATSTSPPSRC